MMAKKVFCTGLVYSHSSWNEYWEGTFKRNNENIGTVTTQMIGWMGNYGLSKKVNLLFSLPYVKTKASAGTMAGMDGLQDVSLFIKWKPLSLTTDWGNFSMMGVGGVSFPATNYVADYLPMSIGLGSKNVLARLIADYQRSKFFITGSGTYIRRSNITIDRDAYYTTQMNMTDEVKMPNASSFNFRTGYRSKTCIVEAVLSNWTTLGGFDITKNNMPFPSNKMDMTNAGVSLRFVPKKLPNLTLTGEAAYTVAGRNVGQATTFSGGAFYIFNFNRASNKTTT
jgi:hypothetical protein